MSDQNDFYIGYQKRAPVELATFLRRVIVLLMIVGAVVAAVLVVSQDPFDPGTFEFGVVRTFEGTLREEPYPVLLADPPVEAGGEPASRLLLVAFGKHGGAAEVAGLDGQRVRLAGSLVYREGEAMIEVKGGSVELLESAASQLEGAVDLGSQTLRGEIVDSKCFLGVMKPGRGKPHRACATRCISGGIPPVLRVETAEGDYRHFLLVDEEGAAVNDQILDLVAEPVEITGRVLRQDDLLLLAANPAGIRRL